MEGELDETPSEAILRRLRAGEPLLSLGVRAARTSDIARMALGAGYHLLWVDLEHSCMPIDTAAAIVAAAEDLGMAGWVRVPEQDYGVIGRLLDGGAGGIIMPKVESADEARLVVKAARFPPRGERSQIALLPSLRFQRLPAIEVARRCDRATLVQILLESAAGIASADSIAAVDGVDILAVGLNDLSADLGCLGNPQHPRLREACLEVANAAARHGKLAVVGGVSDLSLLGELLEAGMAPLLFAAIDTDVMASGLLQRAAEWRERVAG
jgi:2-keto-3-deoxy-L-rhamnonate aldolase RhmA